MWRPVSLLAVAVPLATAPALAQAPELAPVPTAPEPGDLREVEDVVDDAEILPGSDVAPATDLDRANVAAIEAMHAAELSYSNNELRSRYAYGVALGAGAARPWQTYSVDAFFLAKPHVAYGFYAGGGRQRQAGAALSQTYDLTVDARAFGLSGRYFFERLGRLSTEVLLSYAAWEGRLDPHGSADDVEDDVEDDVDKLSVGYRAAGVAGAVGLTLDWVFASGVCIDWTLVGARLSRVQSLELTRASAGADRAVRRDLERAAFYGLTNIRVGYLF